MILTALAVNETIAFFPTAQVMSVIDNVLDLIRAHTSTDIDACRVVSYALAVTTIDSDGQLHAHMLMPEGQTMEESMLLREQCQELLPTE